MNAQVLTDCQAEHVVELIGKYLTGMLTPVQMTDVETSIPAHVFIAASNIILRDAIREQTAVIIKGSQHQNSNEFEQRARKNR